MKKLNQIALVFLLISILWKFTVYTMDWGNEYNFFLALLLIIIASFLGIYLQRKATQERLSFVMELKAALQPTALYILFYSIFLFVYYKFINPTYLPNLHTEMINARVEEAKGLEYTTEQIQQMVDGLESAGVIYDPFLWSSITLFLLIFVGFIYSALLTLILRISKVQQSF